MVPGGVPIAWILFQAREEWEYGRENATGRGDEREQEVGRRGETRVGEGRSDERRKIRNGEAS